MVKNNTGYDLKHWFIGSEGTLGVITRAVLRLHPPRAARHTALVALDGYDAAVNLLRRLSTRFGNDIGAFEIMWPDFYDFGVKLTRHALAIRRCASALCADRARELRRRATTANASPPC